MLVPDLPVQLWSRVLTADHTAVVIINEQVGGRASPLQFPATTTLPLSAALTTRAARARAFYFLPT